MSSARHRAREEVLKGLYEWLVGGGDALLIRREVETGNAWKKLDQEYFGALWAGVQARAPELQVALEPLLDRAWKDVSPVEKSILLLGAFELAERVDVPYRVVINEAVELAKAYGGTDGYKFVNGVLDKLAAALRVDEIASARAADSAA